LPICCSLVRSPFPNWPTLGLCTRSDDDSYHLTDTGAVLSGTANTSFKAWAIFEGEMLAKSWSGMLETITTGSTAAQLLGFNSSFDMMARSPENVSIFNAAMADLTRLVTIDILASYDFSRVLHLMDVGGGSGELIGAVVKTKSTHPRHRVRSGALRPSGKGPSRRNWCG